MKIPYKKTYGKHFKDLPKETQKQQISLATKELTEMVITRMGYDLDAMLLFTLARDFGFGKHRLRRVYDGIFESYRDLRNAWAGNSREVIDDAKRELKSIGVDIELWNEQKRAWLDGGYKNDECWNAHGKKEVEWK